MTTIFESQRLEFRFNISDLILVQSKWNRQNQIQIQLKGIYPNSQFFPVTIRYAAYDMVPNIAVVIDSVLNRFEKLPTRFFKDIFK